MHDLDRSDLVFESGDGFEELEQLEDGDLDHDDELNDDSDDGGVFDDADENELASELLAVGDDRELDQFIGDLISKVRKLPIAKKLRSHLGSLIKGAVKKVLPAVATVAGGAFGGPAGAMLAGKATPYLSGLLGMELEGLSPEDQEFEAAKQLVRMAGTAIENAANLARSSPAAAAAKQAVIEAARQHVPGLVRSATGGGARSGAQQGTWYRRGNKIVIVGV